MDQALPNTTPHLIDLDELADWQQRQATLFADSPSPPRQTSFVEQLVRAVLAGWDFREPKGYYSLLEQQRGAAERTEDLATARRLLERFASSDLFAELAQTNYQRDVEFLLRQEAEHLPVVRGMVDGLWQDRSGRWHLLLFTLTAAEGASVARRLVLAAEALRQQVGSWPEVVVHDLAAGTSRRQAGGRLPHRKVLQALARELRDFCSGGHPAGPQRTARTSRHDRGIAANS
jgi:hypothetical protein